MRIVKLSIGAVLIATQISGGALAQPAPGSEIAPMGKLRVATHVASPILAARTPDGSVSGVTIDLGKFIAERLGVSFEPVIYANQETYAQSFGKGEWQQFPVKSLRQICWTNGTLERCSCHYL